MWIIVKEGGSTEYGSETATLECEWSERKVVMNIRLLYNVFAFGVNRNDEWSKLFHILKMLEAGIAGINIEDSVHSQKRMRSAEEHADYIAALRSAADTAGVELVINARTDAFLGKYEQFDDPLSEAIRRLRLCEAAGARCLYPVKAPDADAVATLLAELSAPINVIAHPVDGSAAGSLADLRAMGVHRISFGPLLQMALAAPLGDLVSPWA